MTPAQIVSISNSLASAQVYATTAYEALTNAALLRLDDFKPAELVELAKKFAYYAHQHVRERIMAESVAHLPVLTLFRQLHQRTTTIMPELTTRQAADCAWAMAKAGIHAPGVLKLLCQHHLSRPDSWSPMAASRTLWASSFMGVCMPALTEHALAVLHSERRQLPEGMAALALHGVANISIVHHQLLNAQQAQVLKDLFNAELEQPRLSNASVRQLMQAHRTLLAVSETAEQKYARMRKKDKLRKQLVAGKGVEWEAHAASGGSMAGSVDIPERPLSMRLFTKDQLEAFMGRVEASKKPSSSMQQHVGRILKAMGVAFTQEAVSKGGHTRVDFIIDKKHLKGARQNKVVVEVDGPSHYLVELPQGGADPMLQGAPNDFREWDAGPDWMRETGDTLARNAFMKYQGITLIVVPYWAWTALQTTTDKKQYLYERLGEFVRTPLFRPTRVVHRKLSKGAIKGRRSGVEGYKNRHR